MADRIPSFEAFYPWYLREHSLAQCRWLHFVGTSGFFATVLGCLYDRPLQFGAAIAVSLVIARLAFGMEGRRSAAPALLAIIVIATVAHPAVLGGIVFAYAMAWIGHFILEKNRPATFTYPLWSLAGDFRMWSEMARGRRWSAVPVAP
jgi:hypothetical protein